MEDPKRDCAVPVDRYQTLFENSADAILMIEGDKFVDCNQAAVEMLHAPDRATVLQTHPSELSPEYQPDGRLSFEKANEYMALAMERGTLRFEWDHKRVDGEVFPVEVLLTAIPTDDGFDLHTVWRDISERKKLESELRHAQKMEAIGKLAGGIAHDFNNQLVPILGYAELLKPAVSESPKLLDWVESIESAGNRSVDLVKRLMAFSHKDASSQGVIELNEAVSELMDMLGQLIGEDVNLEFVPADAPLAVDMESRDLEQIVFNLAANARDALPEGGAIRLSLDVAQGSGADSAILQVIDNGCGMDEQTLAQVFEPFFTTKEVGSGTGLGLSTVYSLVTRAGGSVMAHSRPNEGSRFELKLPLTSAGADEPAADSCSDSTDVAWDTNQFAGIRILVVEDEENVAKLLKGVLSQTGLQVTHAANGDDGLDLIKNQDFDLILTDVIMPGKSGPAMIREKEESGDSTPVIFMSGYTDDRLAAQGFDPGEINLLRKPFSPADLLREIALRSPRQA